MRCCVCGAGNPDYVTNMGRVGLPQTWRARYYCASCWRVLLAWLVGEVALAEGLARDRAPDQGQ
jgi:hypothetical protein